MHLAVDITGLAYKYRTGIARLLEELIDRWAARIQTGAPPVRRMTLLSAFPPGTEFLEKVRNWRNVSVVASNVPSHYVWRQVGLGRMAWKCGADLLYIHEPVAPVICSVPTVLTVNDFFFRDIPQNEPLHILWIYRLITPPSIRHAAALACISQHTLNRLIHFFPKTKERARLIYPGCGFTHFEESEHSAHLREELRRRFNLPSRFAHFAGSATLRKNIDRIFQAMSLLRRQGLDVPLVISGPPSDYAQQCARRAHYDPIYTGFVTDEEVAELYRMASVEVFPSLSEGFGFPIVEAMAAGTPVVTATTTSTGEVAGNAAVLVNPESVEEIALGVRKCLLDADFAQELVRKGTERARDFSWDKCAEEMLDLFMFARRQGKP